MDRQEDAHTRSPLPWGTLNRDQIVVAALGIARDEGLEALSIRRLADRLGVSRMALYRHISDKDDLLDLVADAIADRDLAVPEAYEGSWEERLRTLARAMRSQLLAYKGLTELIVTRGNRGPSVLKLTEAILSILDDAGFDAHWAARYYQSVVDVLVGRVHRELHSALTSPERAERMTAAALAHPAQVWPRLREVGPHLQTVTADEIYETEVELLIGGLRSAPQRRDRCSGSSPAATDPEDGHPVGCPLCESPRPPAAS
ncbi:TetR/AcrR family transcriptional regulator C-terminal domain-containing protein [Streptomyces sp. NPDC023723]|uniref:TetR/AcrR family transcriptional regulator n=1 Tax=Streptomyces sp. NPDC023723 TaxID=3154323 RepID=UPI0033EE3F0A